MPCPRNEPGTFPQSVYRHSFVDLVHISAAVHYYVPIYHIKYLQFPLRILWQHWQCVECDCECPKSLGIVSCGIFVSPPLTWGIMMPQLKTFIFFLIGIPKMKCTIHHCIDISRIKTKHDTSKSRFILKSKGPNLIWLRQTFYQ